MNPVIMIEPLTKVHLDAGGSAFSHLHIKINSKKQFLLVRHRVFMGINVPVRASFILHSPCCTPQTQECVCCVFLTAGVRGSDRQMTRDTKEAGGHQTEKKTSHQKRK